MIEILQGYDRAPIVTLETDDASALESKLSAAARLFTDRKSWQKPFERIAIGGATGNRLHCPSSPGPAALLDRSIALALLSLNAKL